MGKVTPEVTTDVAPDVTPDVAPDVTPDVAPEVTPEATPVVTPELLRAADSARTGLIQRELRVTDEGLLARFAVDPPDGMRSVALDRRPQDIALPAPATATSGDLAWLAGAWVGTRGTGGATSLEERWSPPLGGAMLGTSRTVRGGKMIAFEFLRVVERDGGWVYVAQPGGAPPTEFVLTEWGGTRAFRTLALVSV